MRGGAGCGVSADDRAREIFTARSSIFKVRFSYGA
jgi:hypothetical protein